MQYLINKKCGHWNILSVCGEAKAGLQLLVSGSRAGVQQSQLRTWVEYVGGEQR